MLALTAGLVLGAVPIAAGLSKGTDALVMLAVIVAAGALTAIFGAERVFIAAILVNLPVQLDVYVGWQQEQGSLGALGGMPISVTTLGLAGLVAWRFLVGLPLTPWRYWHGQWNRRAWLCLKLFVAVSALSVLPAPDVRLSLYKLAFFVQLALLFVYLVSTLTRHQMRWVFDLLLAGLIFEFVVIALQSAGLNIGEDAFQGSAGTETFQRVSGMLGSPNTAAGYLNVLALIALTAIVWRGNARQTAGGVLAMMAGVAGLALTLSRGGVLGFAVGIFAFVVLSMRRRQLKLRHSVAIATMATIVTFLAGEQLLLRTASDAGEQGRIALLQIAWEMIKTAPLTGVGLNNFVTVLPDFLTPTFANEWRYAVHNTYALITAESGVFALGAFVAFLGCLVMAAWTASKRLRGGHATFALALLAAVLARGTHMFFDVFNGPVSWHAVIVIAALIAALHERTATPGTARPDRRELGAATRSHTPGMPV
jgi:O-antigen ligase